jgi:hypothetical protein
MCGCHLSARAQAAFKAFLRPFKHCGVRHVYAVQVPYIPRYTWSMAVPCSKWHLRAAFGCTKCRRPAQELPRIPASRIPVMHLTGLEARKLLPYHYLTPGITDSGSCCRIQQATPPLVKSLKHGRGLSTNGVMLIGPLTLAGGGFVFRGVTLCGRCQLLAQLQPGVQRTPPGCALVCGAGAA